MTRCQVFLPPIPERTCWLIQVLYWLKNTIWGTRNCSWITQSSFVNTLPKTFHTAIPACGTPASCFPAMLPSQNLLKQKNSLNEKKNQNPRVMQKLSSPFTQDFLIGPSDVDQHFEISGQLRGDFGGCSNHPSPGTNLWLRRGM